MKPLKAGSSPWRTTVIRRAFAACCATFPMPRESASANGRRFRKMDFDPAFEFLRRERPDYVRDLHTVPEKDVIRLYQPSSGLKAVAEQDARVGKIAGMLAEGGVAPEQMGITGSMLVGLHSSIIRYRFRGLRPAVVEGQGYTGQG